MSHAKLEQTRRSLRGVAELVLAGPQYVASRSDPTLENLLGRPAISARTGIEAMLATRM